MRRSASRCAWSRAATSSCRKLFDHDHAYIFQNPDKRIIFAIPYEGEFTLIGTTDVEHRGAIGEARIDADEIAYLCEQASRYFARRVTPADVVWSYSGVRPLLDDESGDPSAVTRDYALELDTDAGAAADGVGRQDHHLPQAGRGGRRPARRAAAARRAAPGPNAPSCPAATCSAWIGAAQRPDTDFEPLRAGAGAAPPRAAGAAGAPPGARLRRARRARCSAPARLGAEVAPGLYEAELHYLHAHEWARCADDVLWRRSKLGLHYDAHAARRGGRLVPARTGGDRGRGARRRRHGADARSASSSRWARSTHLYPLDLTLVPRAVTVLLGATQAGKTTLMRVMAGLDAPSAGPRAGRRRAT